ncbi:SH3 domain-containing protein [Aestuariivirga sp.]|uniref:SH3 domain-containing protein n=1 Tax=Aestuariivirga sp. TaxID=2650926 RepID=UPI003593059C
MRFFLAAMVAFGLWAGTAPAFADGDIRTEQVQFPPGASGTVIRDSIKGRESVSYTLSARAGQVMSVRLAAKNTATYFNVYAPGKGPGDEALAVSEITGPMVPDLNQFKGTLPETGTYIVSVYLYRNAARRNERSDYTLDIAIADAPAETGAVSDDFADSLSGGPDFWDVRGLAAGKLLNLRSGPSVNDAVVTRLANGMVLRNKGCRMTGSERWCAVERADDAAVKGWVAGRFLRESSYVEGANQSTDAIVPGTDFNATGSIPCARDAGQPMGSCGFGVKRQGNGSATVTVTWPDGGSRVIAFENGTAVRYDESQADGGATLQVTRNADLSIITIGDQRFEIPDAVVYGG